MVEVVVIKLIFVIAVPCEKLLSFKLIQDKAFIITSFVIY